MTLFTTTRPNTQPNNPLTDANIPWLNYNFRHQSRKAMTEWILARLSTWNCPVFHIVATANINQVPHLRRRLHSWKKNLNRLHQGPFWYRYPDSELMRGPVIYERSRTTNHLHCHIIAALPPNGNIETLLLTSKYFFGGGGIVPSIKSHMDTRGNAGMMATTKHQGHIHIRPVDKDNLRQLVQYTTKELDYREAQYTTEQWELLEHIR